MSTAKKPQDRQPKKPSVKTVPGGKQVTMDGLKIVVKEAALKDHRVMQKLAIVQKDSADFAEKVLANGELIDRVLGEKQADLLAAKYADEDGFTDFSVLSQKFSEIIGAAFPKS